VIEDSTATSLWLGTWHSPPPASAPEAALNTTFDDVRYERLGSDRAGTLPNGVAATADALSPATPTAGSRSMAG